MRTDKPALRESFGARPQALREIRQIEVLEQLLAAVQETNRLLRGSPAAKMEQS